MKFTRRWALELDNFQSEKSYTYPITLKGVSIKEKEIISELEVEVNNLVDFISKYKIKIKQ